ncbi:hypothetical protein I302_109201 [Kwoniella bestiolae CBS 10118]|uniref:Uncharacterized protein n=1 Tax=Kwoniella bestiolae CBS 10118 TaxID=1296100 RepID=A0A1B9FVA1_9TREE|nr:hypothetical protein I302_08347 [Kwoniella bestiolae CBS 10118]OCF22696.1 hypothetical protein I302_08347 [Kwoniella bestiolae CBS 10118]
MSPIAIMSEHSGIATHTGAVPSPSPKVLPTDIPRRPSPWHEVAHSLSTTSLPPRRSSVSLSSSATSVNATEPNTPPDVSISANGGSLAHSVSSQALREWDERLSKPSSNISRHQLIPVKTKLAAERDKAGYIEYKLKLIDPTPERFERLITQLMWRLKQGRNEAIYELGLADDGTVIGLPRSQMDASLRTLELMASEVGATVIILREIVLHPSRKPHPLPPVPPLPSASSTIIIEETKTKKGKWKKGGSKRRERFTPKDPRVYGGTTPKKLIFDPTDLAGSSDTSEDEVDGLKHAPSSDEDSSPFFFEQDNADTPPASMLNTRDNSASPSRDSSSSFGSRSKKDDQKRRKSTARSEARRLDLLRGDGTNPMWREMNLNDSNDNTPASSSPSTEILDQTSNQLTSPHFVIPHQPARPSSLRLTSPPFQQEEEPFLDDLLHLPLDSLSLSFADVRELPEPVSPSTTSTSPTETHSPLDELPIGDDPKAQGDGEEMICVEALVVRKLQHDEDGNDEDDEEEVWGYGGEEDVWGFGGDED